MAAVCLPAHQVGDSQGALDRLGQVQPRGTLGQASTTKERGRGQRADGERNSYTEQKCQGRD